MPIPSPPSAHHRFQQAVRLHQSGQVAEAERIYRDLLLEQPEHAESLHLLGVVHQQRGQHELAAGLIKQSLTIDPARATPWSNLGISLHRLGRPVDSLAAFEKALALNPTYAEALSNRGSVLRDMGRLEEALASYDAALRSRPDRLEIGINRSQLLLELKRPDEALAACDRVLQLVPDQPQALIARGHALRALHRHAQSLSSYEGALKVDGRNFAALVGSGAALQSLARHPEALDAYRRALEIKPDALEVMNNRGSVLRDMKRYADAAESFRLLASARPDWDYVESNRLHSQLYCCDWSDYERSVQRISARVMAGEPADVPFSFLAISDSPEAQFRCAARYVSDRYPALPPLPREPRDPANRRIHVAYLSSDYHDHATSYLMAGLFEAHDRADFKVTAISFGPDAEDGMRQRIVPAFDEFIDVRHLSDDAVAALMRTIGVDIAVDLKGFTSGNRAGILARRAAPLQASYLGYPGTMGAPYIDYIIADATVAPAEHQAFFSENIVHLPDSYQVNDRQRQISPRKFTRSGVGLPESGFVFCCFNNNYKISPDVFALWMRLLMAVPGSVLWLLEDNGDASRNLRSQASRHGIAPDRLVFAPKLPVAEHLARHRLADLFLDTLPYNAHTTASDALWAGLPVLTCMGGAFAGRVAASLLWAVQLPELITRSHKEYEALALALARSPDRLAQLREKLDGMLLTAPLFDTDRFRRHLEAAYTTMWQRHCSGEPPAPFSVAARTATGS